MIGLICTGVVLVRIDSKKETIKAFYAFHTWGTS